jgi:aldose 1-epimerase
VTLQLEAETTMPATIGWHPWFRRTLTGTTDHPLPASDPVSLRFDAARMYARGADGLPTGEVTGPGPRPWDDCFTGLRSTPRLTWPGVLTLEMDASCDHWVVYDEPVEAVCVEPQTGPPDAVNIAPRVIVPDQPLTATMRWRWWPDREDPAR